MPIPKGAGSCRRGNTRPPDANSLISPGNALCHDVVIVMAAGCDMSPNERVQPTPKRAVRPVFGGARAPTLTARFLDSPDDGHFEIALAEAHEPPVVSEQPGMRGSYILPRPRRRPREGAHAAHRSDRHAPPDRHAEARRDRGGDAGRGVVVAPCSWRESPETDDDLSILRRGESRRAEVLHAVRAAARCALPAMWRRE